MIMSHVDALLKQRHDEVEDWIRQAYGGHYPNFYSSVDLRHSGTKLVPVDTNLFPAGFNHLSAAARERAKKQISAFIASLDHEVKTVMILPENHTRNTGYIDNICALSHLFEDTGYTVIIGSLDAEQTEPLALECSNGDTLMRMPVHKVGTEIQTLDGTIPELIIVNNDMSAGAPELLKGVTQTTVPRTGKGWYRRKKSIHFDAYAQVAKQFAEHFNLDWWQLAAVHHKCGMINFRERKGVDCVALGVEKVLRQVKEKYAEYGIEDEPYVFVKADSGTYGMGIMTVTSGDEIVEMNKKSRNKMNVIKEGVQSTEVIIQEGVPSIDTVSEMPAEPMIYCVNGKAVGGAYRVNEARDARTNLNASGMQFMPICDADESGDNAVQVTSCNFGVYGLMAQLATLAAAREEYGEMYWI